MKTNAQIHEQILKILVDEQVFRKLNILLKVSKDLDKTLQRVMNVLASTQVISLDIKDALRVKIKHWVRQNFEESLYFADDRRHLKKKRK
jgi:hypothetical protein